MGTICLINNPTLPKKNLKSLYPKHYLLPLSSRTAVKKQSINLKPIILGNFKSFNGENLPPVAFGTVADVDPAHTLLVDELVERQLQLLNELEEAAVLLQRTGRALDIDGTACHVVGRGRASHNGVETGAAVAAADINGLAVGLAQGVQDVLYKSVDVV